MQSVGWGQQLRMLVLDTGCQASTNFHRYNTLFLWYRNDLWANPCYFSTKQNNQPTKPNKILQDGTTASSTRYPHFCTPDYSFLTWASFCCWFVSKEEKEQAWRFVPVSHALSWSRLLWVRPDWAQTNSRQDGWSGKDACDQVWWLQLNLQNPHTRTGTDFWMLFPGLHVCTVACRHTSMHTHTHMHAHTHTYTKLHIRKDLRLSFPHPHV